MCYFEASFVRPFEAKDLERKTSLCIYDAEHSDKSTMPTEAVLNTTELPRLD